MAVCSSVRWKCMGSALAAHREGARQAESPFADDVALDVRRPARDRIAEAAHDLIHPFFGAARPAVAAAARTSGFDETMLSDQILREQRTGRASCRESV